MRSAIAGIAMLALFFISVIALTIPHPHAVVQSSLDTSYGEFLQVPWYENCIAENGDEIFCSEKLGDILRSRPSPVKAMVATAADTLVDLMVFDSLVLAANLTSAAGRTDGLRRRDILPLVAKIFGFLPFAIPLSATSWEVLKVAKIIWTTSLRVISTYRQFHLKTHPEEDAPGRIVGLTRPDIERLYITDKRYMEISDETVKLERSLGVKREAFEAELVPIFVKAIGFQTADSIAEVVSALRIDTSTLMAMSNAKEGERVTRPEIEAAMLRVTAHGDILERLMKLVAAEIEDMPKFCASLKAMRSNMTEIKGSLENYQQYLVSR